MEPIEQNLEVKELEAQRLAREEEERQRLETEIKKTKQIKSKSLMKLGDNHDVVVVELNGLASDGNWHVQFDDT